MTENYLNILADTIRNNWNQPALTDFYLTEDGSAQDTSRGNHYTYGEMYAEICRVANLLTSLGLQKGDHIAICGTNSAHWVIAYLAIAKMQGVSVTVMHSLMPEDIAQMIDFSDAKALFTDEELWAELKEKPLPQVKNVISLANWNVLCGEKQSINHKSKIINGECGFDFVEPDSLAMICFTSGSTGGAKGVMLSHKNLGNNVSNGIDAYPEDTNPNFLCVLPMSHMYGLMIEILSQIVRGKHIWVMKATPRIDNIWAGLMCISPYAMAIIPAIMERLYANYGRRMVGNLHFCKQIHIGGASFSHDLTRELRQQGLPLSIGYGLTETGPLISDSQSKKYRLLSCGRVVSGMTCRIAPTGEILVKGENVMLGYYKDPEATARKIDKDGWLHTGDKGHLDEDGYLYVEGRLEQDMIVLPNGENIHPEDIERKINALPEVKESIVLAREGKLVAIVVSQITNDQSPMNNTDLRRMVLRTVNPELPLYSQLYDVEITDVPLQKTDKQTIKRYLYK